MYNCKKSQYFSNKKKVKQPEVFEPELQSDSQLSNPQPSVLESFQAGRKYRGNSNDWYDFVFLNLSPKEWMKKYNKTLYEYTISKRRFLQKSRQKGNWLISPKNKKRLVKRFK